jgi:hypothetical protein
VKAIVTGMIATYPVGGVAWDYGQYVLALQRLGFEVCYLEDTGGPCYHPQKREYGPEPRYGLEFLDRSLRYFDAALGDRWHFRAMDDATYGMEKGKFAKELAEADVLLNVSGSALLRDEYLCCPRKVLIDTDPGWNHFVNYPRWDASPNWLNTHGYRAHDSFFTYAERIGQSDCLLPSLGLNWHPTRPPVIMDRWQTAEQETTGKKWTTVMTWNNFGKPVVYDNQVFGTKEMEFNKIETLPQRLPRSAFMLAVGGSDYPAGQWQKLGWEVQDSHAASVTAEHYRAFIQNSRGEFSVVKNLYSATRSGWFSCRSVCYLAAGRPVVIQDTGFSEFIPTGAGLFAFADVQTAEQAIELVEGNLALHQQAAREVAFEYFDSGKVLGKLLAQAGLQ